MRKKTVWIYVMLMLVLFGGCGQKQPVKQENFAKERGRMVCVNNVLWYDTGKESTVEGRCGVMDGEIVYSVAANQVPSRDNESNFGTGYSYQFMGDSLEVLIDGQFIVFSAQEERLSVSAEPETDFSLAVQSSETPRKIKILNTAELGLTDCYNLYYYGVDNVYVWINYEKIPLETALRQGKLTLDDLLEKTEAVCSYDDGGSILYRDGGSRAYASDAFTVIKYNTLDGNRDLYIGCAEMDISVADI